MFTVDETPPNLDCYVPFPTQFSAVYDNATGITLNWHTPVRPAGRKDCGRVLIEISVRSYQTYSEFASAATPAVTPYSPLADQSGLEYQLLIDDVRLDNYYVFDLRVKYLDKFGSLQTVVKPSPILFFGVQGW